MLVMLSQILRCISRKHKNMSRSKAMLRRMPFGTRPCHQVGCNCKAGCKGCKNWLQLQGWLLQGWRRRKGENDLRGCVKTSAPGAPCLSPRRRRGWHRRRQRRHRRGRAPKQLTEPPLIGVVLVLQLQGRLQLQQLAARLQQLVATARLAAAARLPPPKTLEAWSVT